ncbi:hypothetical protein NUU61_001446 [Penicillium alfredii]|uniref:Uncharacterized protein n=1 Tax=Penicillium alfredii TaxID=1506179 RepID=A0A9W9G4F9_9EURO|nr:uncharacterized protein NUU61_001446 [Penicillium alfredii]KAJ5111816.1 hypothetical protein NUU61_001446 [Penicillium alfredii]
MANSRDNQSSSEPVSLLGELQHILMASHSPSTTGESSADSPELSQDDDHRSHASGDDSCDENYVVKMDEDDQEEQQPRAIKTESVLGEPDSSRHPTLNTPGDPVAYTLIRDLDDRVHNNEDRLRKQGTFNDGTHQYMNTMSQKIRALETKVDRLQEMVNELWKARSTLTVERKTLRSKRSTQ